MHRKIYIHKSIDYMSNVPKFGPVYHLNNHHIAENKLRTGQIIQPSPKKSFIFLHPSPIIPTPPNKGPNPEIIHPNCINKTQNCINHINKVPPAPASSPIPHRTLSRSQSLSLNTLDKPLDALEQFIPKKNYSRRHRNSCSSDISWSPNMILPQKENIRHRRSTNLSDDHGSPLCNQDLEDL